MRRDKEINLWEDKAQLEDGGELRKSKNFTENSAD